MENRELIPKVAWRNNPPADLIPGRPLLGRICFTWNTRGRQRTLFQAPTLLAEALTARLRLPMGSRCRVVGSSHVLRSERADWKRASVSRGTFEVGLGPIYRNTSLVIQRSRLLRPREYGKDIGFDAMCGAPVKEPAWLGGRRRLMFHVKRSSYMRRRNRFEDSRKRGVILCSPWNSNASELPKWTPWHF